MMGSKLYVVTSVALVQAIQKQTKAFAFSPITARFSAKVLGTSAEATKTMIKNCNEEEGDWGLLPEMIATMRAAVVAGPDLDQMNRVMVQRIAALFDSLEVSTDKTKLKLATWVRSVVMLAITDSIWGPQNPFMDDSVANAFWYMISAHLKIRIIDHWFRQFESNLMSTHILPAFMARKGIAGRTKVAKAFEHYHRIQGHKKASKLVRDRHEIYVRHGIGGDDAARYEAGTAIAFILPAASAPFWMLLLVYSYPGLLDEIRKELDAILINTVDNNGLIRYLDITSLKTNCRLLTSTFQEVLRYRSMGLTVRLVMEDTVLNGQWLLKKDSMVQIPSRVFHTDSTLWGTDVDKFNPRRFMNDGEQKAKRPNPAAFRAFGGGTTLCPGRHFATNQGLAMVSMFIMRYEMTPTKGEWSMPTTINTSLGAGVMQPDTDVEVEVSTRKGFEDGRWEFVLKSAEATVAMAAEDFADPTAG